MENETDPGKIWNIVNTVCGNKTSSSGCFPNKQESIDSQIVTDQKTIAEILNTYFTGIEPKLAEKFEGSAESCDKQPPLQPNSFQLLPVEKN